MVRSSSSAGPAWSSYLGVLATILAGVYGVGVFDSLGQGGFDDPATEAAQELAHEQDVFGNKRVDVIAIYPSEDLTVDDPAFQAEVEETLAGIPDGTTTSVATLWDTERPADGEHGQARHQVLISLAGDTQDEQLDSYDALVPALEADELETDIAGPWAVYNGVNETVSEDLARAETDHAADRADPLAADLRQPGRGADAGPGRRARGARRARRGPGAHQLHRGLGLLDQRDHAARHGPGDRLRAVHRSAGSARSWRGCPETTRTPSAKAIAVTMPTAGRTVLFSGLTVAAAMSSLLVFPQNFLRSMGYGGIAAVLVAMVAALTVLPAILLLLGRRIDAGRMPWRRAPARLGRHRARRLGPAGARA